MNFIMFAEKYGLLIDDVVMDVVVEDVYGLNTRLLDVSENPLVALYFVCASRNDKECKDDKEVLVIAVNNHKMK